MAPKENIIFRELAGKLREEFLRPEWTAGMALESESVMMERFGVSRKTVRNALERLSAEGLIGKSRGKRCTLLRKPPDENRSRRGLNFGIVGNETVVDSAKSDIPAVAQGIIAELGTWNATLSIFPFLSKEYPGILPVVKSLVEKRMTDGFFVFACPDSREACAFLREHGIPYVYVASSGAENMTDSIPCVLSEEREQIRTLCRELPARKIRKLVLLAGENDLIRGRTNDLFREEVSGVGIEYRCFVCKEFSIKEFIGKVKELAAPNTALMTSNEFAPALEYAREVLDLKPGERIAELLLYKHYAPDWTNYKKNFRIIERPYLDIGREAARKIRETVLHPVPHTQTYKEN